MRVKLYGPPGTGKTRSLLRIVEKALSAGIPPQRIAYVTFTVRGRQEAVQRANDVLGLGGAQLEYFRTLHSIAYRQLGLTRGSLITSADQLRDFGHTMGLEFPSKYRTSIEDDYPTNMDDAIEGGKLLAFDHFARQMCLPAEKAWRHWQGSQDLDVRLASRFSRAYSAWKDSNGLFDFTDLLEFPIKPLDVDLIIVDEAQDLSPLQWRLFEQLAQRAERIYVAGDDDQAIYQWAGADPDAFVAFAADSETTLKQSYRVPRSVQRIAERIINPVKGRKVKDWRPRDSEGAARTYGDIDSVLPLLRKDEETLILFRTHSVGSEVESELRTNGVPYAYADDSLPQAFTWAPAIHTLHRLKTNGVVFSGHILDVLRGIATTPAQRKKTFDYITSLEENHVWTAEEARRIGIKTEVDWPDLLTKMRRYDLDYLLAIRRHRGFSALFARPLTRISTIHAAKGAQAEHVVLYTHITGRVRESIEEDASSERRVFYVGVTRALERLSIVGVENPLF